MASTSPRPPIVRREGRERFGHDDFHIDDERHRAFCLAGHTSASWATTRIVFEDEAGFSMTPPRARTWGRRGHTPVIRVRGRYCRRTSVAALCCYKPGQNSRLIHRHRSHLLLKGARKSFSWKDYRDLLVRAHIQLGGPTMVVWDGQRSARERAVS